jgi:hypothetical protein
MRNAKSGARRHGRTPDYSAFSQPTARPAANTDLRNEGTAKAAKGKKGESRTRNLAAFAAG